MFVGRERELAELTAALVRAAATSGGLYFIAGEPGIGKTRLASEIAADAREGGVRVSWGRCWEAGGAPAYWPWREALEGIGVAFPDPSAIPASTPAESRFMLSREVISALGCAATPRPLLIVLEDLHAADRSTLLVLELIADQVRSMPVMVLGTYRELEASLRPDCGDAIARLGRVGQVLTLPPLREIDVALLVRDGIEDADDRLTAIVYDATHGNPLFVDEMVRDVRARGVGGGMRIPLGVREVIRQRLRFVSDDARPVLEAGAVLGVEFEGTVVERITTGAAVVLEEATRSGLVSARRSRFRFTHALYRDALYHDVPRARRQELHRQAARALTATTAPWAEIAHHLFESGAEAAPEAIDYALRAAESALDVFAFEDAEALLDRARAAIPPGPLERMLKARVLIATGEAKIRGGDPTGRELCVEAAEIARQLGDGPLLARAALGYGAVLTMGTVDPVMVGLLSEALARLPQEDSPLRARVMARLAAARQPSLPTVEEDIALALDAIAMARRVADARELLAVLHAASGALYGAASPRIRLPISREQEQLAEQLGDTTRLLHARVRLAMDFAQVGDFSSYEKLAASYESLATRIGRAAAPWRVSLMRSMLALLKDRFDESQRFQADARERESERPAARRAQAFHRIGFLRAAERHMELKASIAELRNLWLDMPFGGLVADAHVASSLARIGAHDEVRTIMEELSDDAMSAMLNAPPLAEAVWLTGDPKQAAAVRQLLEPYAERWSLYWLDCEIVEAPHARLLAYLEGIIGNWNDADTYFADALALIEAVGRRSMAARMRFEYGDLLVRTEHDPDRGRTLLAEARAEAHVVGLEELVALIDRRHPNLARRAPEGADSSRGRPPFTMTLEGEYFAVQGTRGTLRFKTSRGMQYVARLVERPGVDIHVLDLAGSADHADRGDAGELLDAPAFRAYRARLVELKETMDDAEALGNAEKAERARDEMETIARELAKATGRAGRARRAESAVDRARSAVQRRIKDALDRIAEQDAELGAWLRRTIRTGNYCSYRPDG